MSSRLEWLHRETLSKRNEWKQNSKKLFACYFTVLNVYINYLSNLVYLQLVSKIISKNCVTSVVYLAPFLHIFELLVSRMLGTFIYFLFLSISLNYFVYSTSFSLNDFKSLSRATCFFHKLYSLSLPCCLAGFFLSYCIGYRF